MSTDPIPSVQAIVAQGQQASQNQAIRSTTAAQIASQNSFESWTEQGAGNATLQSVARRAETLESRIKRKEKPDETQETEEVVQIEEVSEVLSKAEKHEENNPELKSKDLLALKQQVTEDKTEEEILDILEQFYPDPTLADEALDFLISVSNAEFAAKLHKAKEALNKRYGKKIRAGKNALPESHSFSDKGIGSPTELRDTYRGYIDNPKDPHDLFDELRSKYTYEQMRDLITFLLKSLGADLRSQGPSIEKGALFRLLTEARNLQAIWGVYRYFMQKEKSLDKLFGRYGIPKNPSMNFEHFSDVFMKYLKDRYPSFEKVLLIGMEFGLTDDLIGQEVLLNCMREGLRQVSPKLFRSPQHRQDVIVTFLEALDAIEDKIDEAEEKEKK